MKDRFAPPAGHVVLQGPYFAENRERVMATVYAHEARLRASEPSCRVLGTSDQGVGVVITCSDPSLARAIALALQAAFKGDLDLVFGPDETFVHATWTR